MTKNYGPKKDAKALTNAEFQEKRYGDMAVMFFKQTCPYCREAKEPWNQTAKAIMTRWNAGPVSGKTGGKSERAASQPEVRKVNVIKFANIKKTIGFPTVPCFALYKTGKPVIFLTTKDRSTTNMTKIIEDYYKYGKLPPKDEYLVGTDMGTWPFNNEADGEPSSADVSLEDVNESVESVESPPPPKRLAPPPSKPVQTGAAVEKWTARATAEPKAERVPAAPRMPVQRPVYRHEPQEKQQKGALAQQEKTRQEGYREASEASQSTEITTQAPWGKGRPEAFPFREVKAQAPWGKGRASPLEPHEVIFQKLLATLLKNKDLL